MLNVPNIELHSRENVVSIENAALLDNEPGTSSQPYCTLQELKREIKLIVECELAWVAIEVQEVVATNLFGRRTFRESRAEQPRKSRLSGSNPTCNDHLND